jgi:hypothetical protein
VFDGLKKLFGGGKAPPPATASRRSAAPRPRRAAGARPRGAAGSSAEPRRAVAASPEMAQETACPNCGEPMLAGWGATCGKCRPTMVAPKTMFGARVDLRSGVAPAPGLSLGWLVILRSVDPAHIGQICELEADEVVLSRARAFSGDAARVLAFEDEFMSGAHATIRRPRTPDKSDAFTLRDRRDPGPSANGTFLNAHKLGAAEEARLADGDIIKVGATELLFKSLWLPPDGARPWG